MALVIGLVSCSLAAIAFPAGCSSSNNPKAGSFSCEGSSPCPNDPVATDDVKCHCREAVTGSCGSEFTSLGQCLATAGCTSAGKTDDTKCADKTAAYQTCVEKTPQPPSQCGGNDAGVPETGNDSGGTDGGSDAADGATEGGACGDVGQPCCSGNTPCKATLVCTNGKCSGG